MSFDKIAAVYVYCMNYSGGMWSQEYHILCKIQKQYKLRLTDHAIREIQGDDENNEDYTEARAIYKRLVGALQCQ